jgi:uncharacterized protein with ATP-grasp and redox domains
MSTLDQALSARFTDLDEINDVANYGCIGGVSDFIYHDELNKFFNDHEDEIYETLALYEVKLQDLKPEFETLDELKERAVWFVVEAHCQGIILAEEFSVSA